MDFVCGMNHLRCLAVYILDIVRITSSVVWMRIFCIHFCRTATIDPWMVSESLMWLYFLTIEMFLAYAFPSLYLLMIIADLFTLATVNKPYAQ